MHTYTVGNLNGFKTTISIQSQEWAGNKFLYNITSRHYELPCSILTDSHQSMNYVNSNTEIKYNNIIH